MLRGFALLGVFIANLVGFSEAPWLATEAQIAALPSARADTIVSFAISWLVHDKANTLFAFPLEWVWRSLTTAGCRSCGCDPQR